MAVDLISSVNKSNAFDGGFLDSKYAQRIVDRCNIWNNMLVQSPVGVSLGNWVVSESNAILVLNSSSFGYPWIESDALASSYAAVLGTGTASFSSESATALSAFEIQVTGGDAASSLSLVIGDSDPNDNDLFNLQGNKNSVLTQWFTQPETTWKYVDGSSNVDTAYVGVRAGSPTVVLNSFTGDSITLIPQNGAGALNLTAITALTDLTGGTTTFYALQ